MAADEELNAAKLNELKNALDDLKIVDVARKPEGLSADLKASPDFLNKKESLIMLQGRGFYAARLGDQFELFSKEGEIRCLMKDGVEYVLRFGNVVTEEEGEGAKPEEKPDEKDKDQPGGEKKDQKPSKGLNRYLLVTAEFNPEAISKPQLEETPEEKAEGKVESKAAEEKPAAEKDAAKPEEKPAEANAAVKAEAKPEDKAAETKDAAKDAAKPDGKAADKKESTKPEEKPADEKDSTKDAEPAAEKDAAKPEEKSAENPENPEKPKDKAAVEAERKRIERDNKRKQEEYEEKVAAGKKHAKELNARFADWYYVISDDVYRKIHLTRADIVKKKEQKDEHAGHERGAEPPPPGNPLEQFKDLQKEGPGGGK